jgi:TonB-dependent receptor
MPFFHFPRWLRAGSALALATFLFVSVAPAQTGAGTITGRVSDIATGRSLQGAVVKLPGTTAFAYTDATGRFSLPGLPPGDYKVEVDYVGLDPYFTRVTLGTGQSVTVEAALDSHVLKLAAVTVAESARGAAQAINQQKTASGIVNIVSEETFSNMIGGNIGFTLQQLPGLTVNEDEDGTPSGVNIRGLEAKYNSFQIDGNRMPSSGNSRGFSTGQLTADGISNIEVVKAATPDRDGDAIGGIINVISRSAFQRDGRSFELTGSGLFYDKYDKWGYNLGLTYLDLVDVLGGHDNLGLSLNLTRYKSSRDYDNLDKDYALVTPQLAPHLNLKEPVYVHVNGTPQTNFRDTIANGFSGSIDYRLSASTSLYLRPFYTATTVDAEKPRNRYYMNGNGSFTTATALQIQELTYNTGRSTPATLTDFRYQNEFSTTDNDTYGASLGGRTELDTLTFTYDAFASTNESNRDRNLSWVIRNPGFSVGYDQTDRARPKYTIFNGRDPYDTSTINRGDLTIAPRDAAEKAFSARLDVEKKLAGSEVSTALKVGVKARVNKKEQDQASRVYRTGTAASGFPYASIMRRSNRAIFGIPMTLEPDMAKTEDLLRNSPNLFVLQTADALLNDVVNDYHAEEDINAAYVMGTWGWGRSTMIAGLRLEQNTFKSDTFRFNAATPAAPTAVHAKREYDVWLPGIHFRHALAPNLILRESYNRSYSRPDIDKMVAGLQLDSATGNISGGNPNLRETTSDNFDAQIEYYTARGGLYSAGVFYKEMKGFYYSSTARFTTTDASGYPIVDGTGPYVFSTTLNALGATNYGLELIGRQKLYFLPKPFDGFSVSLSATFTESDGKYPGRLTEKLPTYGFSDTIYNAALEYNAGKFRARLSYTYRSDYLEGLDVDNTFDDYFGAYESLNWESSYQLTKKAKLFFNVNNLTDEPQISYQGYKHTDNPEDYTTYSWRATAGITLKF